MVTWLEHVNRWKDCQRCPLGGQRDRICLARGTLPCDVLFVGEAPGISEDTIGQPFVGPAGHYLDQIIERAIPTDMAVCPHEDCTEVPFRVTARWGDNNDVTVCPNCGRQQAVRPAMLTWAMTNLVACFPREAKSVGFNEPERGEILECRPRLVEFVNIARPKLIVCVGTLAAQYINHGDTVRCIDIVHPAHILRMPLAQQRMAAQKCIVQIGTAVDDVLQSTETFREWGTAYAQGKPQREQLRAIYRDADSQQRDLPF